MICCLAELISTYANCRVYVRLLILSNFLSYLDTRVGSPKHQNFLLVKACNMIIWWKSYGIGIRFFITSEGKVNTFLNEQQLQAWLKAVGVNTALWGEGQAKTVGHLWVELDCGEAKLIDDPPLRLVDVVQIIIRRGKQVLLEVKQELDNNQVRFRNQPPSEKIKAGEDYSTAALRCLVEELGVKETAVTILHDTYTTTESETDSLSYPGLRTRYTFHLVEAIVSGLPNAAFWCENKAHGEGDPIVRHWWAWRYNR
jgi:ADP-ribose pyrophosphatase YjhB (NUDIX family)